MGKYIGELEIITGKDAKASSGFTRLDTDLNGGAKGDYIYLCYKKTDNRNDAITGITFVHGEDAPKPSDYDTKLDKDLNKGAKGEYIYLCYRKKSGEDPITDLCVISGKENTITPDKGFIRINDDLNAGAGGLFIYLCYKPALEIIAPDDRFSFKVKDVPKAFSNLSENGKNETFDGLPYFTNIGFEHIQGYTQYQDSDGQYYYFFTHNTTGAYGYILVSRGTDGKNVKKLKLDEGWSHPGGIQAVGQYLFVPCEKNDVCKISIYDAKNMNHIKSFLFDHNAGCIGITDFKQDGKPYYLLLVGDQEKYYGYTAEITDNISDLNFTPVGSIDISGKGHSENDKEMNCQAIGLVTDEDGTLYMIAMKSYPDKAPCSDWAYLIKITVSNGEMKYDKVEEKHFISKGGLAGVDGTHFRWGAGIRIQPSGRLVLLATSRNILSNKLNTNYWR